MLYYIGTAFEGVYGPFRLLTSHLFLTGLALFGCGLLTFMWLPKLAQTFLPRDRGRNFAVDGKAAQGKPTGAGMIFIPIYLGVLLLVMPLNWEFGAIFLLTFGASLFGYLDDQSKISWSEYRKGLIDLLIAVAAALVLSECEPQKIWLPFTKMTMELPVLVFVPLAVIFIWATINTTNCTDGVDGLSGTLSSIAFLSLGTILYFALGHSAVANYLLLPHYSDGASWGMMAFAMVGTLAGYLWYNAHPSSLLMGDAGSRAIGFLLGVLVIKCGNPFLIFMVSGVLLVNGGTGLVKVALLRFAKIAIFRTVRFPLHDHVRHNHGWSNTQVLVRFALIQCMMTLVFIVLLLKLR